MMSSYALLPCFQILHEHFGDIIQQIGSFLLKHPASSLRVIIKETNVPANTVKRAICSLLHQNIARYEKNKGGIAEYSVDARDILIRMRFSRFIYSTKLLYGDAAERITEELLANGQLSMSSLIEKVKTKLASQADGPNLSVYEIKEKFVFLAKTQFVQRFLNDDEKEDEDAPDLLYAIPEVDLKVLENRKRKRESDASSASPAPPAKRYKAEDSCADEGIYWRINYERFNQYLRDQELIQAYSRKIDRIAGEILRTILRLSEVITHSEAPVTNPIAANEVRSIEEIIKDVSNQYEIYNSIPREICSARPLLDQYLSVMADDASGFLRRMSDSGGGMYSVDFRQAFRSLATAHVESVIQERFGSKCLRIFRLLMMKKHLEQKQIEECAMIPAKETKEMLYTMFGHNFVHLTEIPKTPDHAPARTFYLFSVDLNQIARMLIVHCHKTIYNLMCRREHETKEHRRVLEKQQRVVAILSQLEQQQADDSQKDEVKDMITPAERAQLVKIEHSTNKIEKSEQQLDNTLFVLEKFLQYDSSSALVHVT